MSLSQEKSHHNDAMISGFLPFPFRVSQTFQIILNFQIYVENTIEKYHNFLLTEPFNLWGASQ